GDVRAGVEPRRRIGAGDLVIIRPAGDLLALMDQRDELAVAIGAETETVPGLSAIAGDREALVARRDQLDRAVEPFRGDRDQRGALCQRPARAERPTDIR